MKTQSMMMISMAILLAILPSNTLSHPSEFKKSNHIFMVQEHENDDLIETTCKNTPNYQLCISILKFDARSRGADVYGLGLVVVDAVKEKTIFAMEAIEKMTSSNPNPELIIPLLKCKSMYNAVLIGDIPEAINGLRLGNPKFAEFGMDDAALEVRLCDGGFQHSNSSPLAAMNKDIYDLSLVAKSIIRMLL